jgi:hypothetical protein
LTKILLEKRVRKYTLIPEALKALKGRIEGDPRLALEAKREIAYYQEQSQATATFLRILTAFLAQSLMLDFLGGVAGLALAAFLQFFTVSTTNFQTFSELAFQFRLSGAILAEGLGFALVMGLAGGLLPAFRAARMNIVEALREA